MDNIENTRKIVASQLSEKIKEGVEEIKKDGLQPYKATVADLILGDVEDLSKRQLEATKLDVDRVNKILENVRKRLLFE